MRVAFITILLLITGCASHFKYQKATENWYAGYQGYFEKELNKEEKLLSYAWIGGYEWSSNKIEDIKKLSEFWVKRANEICPKGYKGKAAPMYPWESKNEKIATCDRRYCANYPLVEGVIKCE